MSDKTINRTFLIVLLGILAAIGPFTIDMYIPGFKQIAGEFKTTESVVAFTLTSYFGGIAIGQLIYGPLVDKYGRKKPLLIGLMIYILAALGCAVAPNINALIGTRMLQALGGCVGMVASNAIISDVYEKDKRAKAFSLILLVMGIAPVIAPTVGSFFLDLGSWRIIFYFLAIFAALVALLIGFVLPETSKYMHKNKLKVSVITANYVDILRNPTFLFYTLAGSVSMSILFAYISSSSFVFQTVYGLEKEVFAIIFAINAIGLVIGNTVNGFLVGKINYLKLAKWGSVAITIVSLIVMSLFLIFPSMPYSFAVIGLFFILLLINFINPNATAASMVPFTATAGAASALGGAMRMGIGAVVAALIGLFQGNSALTMFVVIAGLSMLVMLMLFFAPKVNSEK